MTEEIIVSNLEVNINRVLKELENLNTALKEQDNQGGIVEAVKNIKYDNSNVEVALKQLHQAVSDIKLVFPDISFAKESKEITTAIETTTRAISEKEMSVTVNTDLKKVERLLDELLKKELPKTVIPEADYTEIVDGLDEVRKAIKNIKISGGGGGGSADVVGAKNSIDQRINPATSENQLTEIGVLESIAGFNIPANDEIVLTYVVSGNGVGEVETVVYKLATVTLATLTLSYDSNNNLVGVIKT